MIGVSRCRALRPGVLAAVILLGSGIVAPEPVRAVGPPEPPSFVAAVAFDRSVRIRWAPPSDEIGVDAYRVRRVGTDYRQVVPAGRREVVVGWLANGVAVSFTVAAHGPGGWGAESVPSAVVTPTRPNLLLVVTDDARADAVTEMPWLASRRWRRFANAFVPEPQCCPSRASILTGRLPAHTGVDTLENGAKLDARLTIATMLRSVGYRTALAGKYLNGAPFPGRPYPPPGWTDFVRTSGYFNYHLFSDGSGPVWHGTKASDYSTDVLRRHLVEIISGTPAPQPLFLYFAPTAPHRQANGGDPVPAPRHIGSCATRPYPLPPSFNARDRISTPAWLAAEPLRSPAEMLRWRRAACESLRAVDEAIAGILGALAAAGRAENTYVIYTSDNGYHFGEHRLVEKGDLYDEAIHVPLVVGGPAIVAGTDSRLTSTIDLVPTLLEWARVAPPAGFVDGVSFAASARGQVVAGPDAVLLDGCRTAKRSAGGSGVCGGYPAEMPRAVGLRTVRHKYVEYVDGSRQLFDLAADPYELYNIAAHPAQAATVVTLAARLAELRGS